MLLFSENKKYPLCIALMRKQYKPGMVHVSSVVRFCDISMSVLSITFLHSPAIYGCRVETYGPYSQDYMRSCFDFMFILTTDMDNVNDIIERYKNSFY
ncbi:Hypothetical protein A7A1_3106 [Bacillus subtilis subsp. subtilis str. BSP1]|uniref:Uncharacterized protein n=1 Tax=Bacillus subtilis TaxID=1423 RepID=A0A0D1L4I1_BACIU|nr:Hypothetical protein A7A1_3106 [Bacillus subtilis subsp. subtilis str. BSP1]KIU10586.1 hypothetical protein SC09_Contig25orf00370 [Bacillus subtilis]